MIRAAVGRTCPHPWIPWIVLASCLLLSACADIPFSRAPHPSQKPAIAAPPAGRPAAAPQPDGYASACIALLLPDSGPFAPFAEKIRGGAAAAQRELAHGGFTADVRFIDTAQPDWLARLEALPPQCAVVGGPLQTQSYAAAKAAGAVSRRHFFAFLPHLASGEEGRIAWRFFPGPMDQINALLHFTRQDLGITSYGVFYPADVYGSRMAGLFEEAARKAGGTVHAVSYPPGDMTQWPKAAEQLAQPRMVNKVPLPTIAAGAVFLPDSWKNMDMVTTSLLYNGEDRQVLLGTSLWEQSLAVVSTVNAHNYQLAVFPGAWDPHRAPPALLQAAPGCDFWVGLGYDFVRFGAALGVRTHIPAQAFNERIRYAQNMLWAMAPMRWDAQGRASQGLYLFTPAPTGFVPLDVTAFKERRAQMLARFERRNRAASSAAQGR